MSQKNPVDEIILKELKISKIEETIDMDYPDSKDSDIDRKKISFFANRYRGSVRLIKGLFYTPKEFEQRVQVVCNIKLP